MVFVKVRETYDLHTIKNKMTIIAVHTPKPDIIKRNYPGLLMQCRAYRPVAADVRIACASLESLDPLQVGTVEGAVAPEDVFNPILYKAMSNKGMSQLEARINALSSRAAGSYRDVDGSTAAVDTDSLASGFEDDFGMYYGLLSNTHDWKHANPQSGLSMSNLRPFVYEMVYNVGDQVDAAIESPIDGAGGTNPAYFKYPQDAGNAVPCQIERILGKAKEMPFLNCTSYSGPTNATAPGFPVSVTGASNAEIDVPYINVVCGCIIVPPSRLHELFYRMVVEWTIEFSQIRPLSEIVTWGGLAAIGAATHYQNYSYTSAKEALTGSPDTVLENDAAMVSANVDINKVM